jgi:branched-chain amino acid transport system substrate-binding protein
MQLRKLPWHFWELFERRPLAEIALSSGYAPASRSLQGVVKILAILGSSEGINVEKDREMLEELSNAEVDFLVEPGRQELSDKLFEKSWDILFFAGHSATVENGETGKIYINANDSLTISQLKYALRNAVQNGLKLAIFNSCDGLGLANNLADLHIPHTIVMREPVPDKVAQSFLKYFLKTFSRGESFYLSVRKAREQLHAMESEYPCASWLPVICQNPAAGELKYPQPKYLGKKTLLGLAGAIALSGIFLLGVLAAIFGAGVVPQPRDKISNSSSYPQERISSGEKILIAADNNPDKQAGVEAFAKSDFDTAISKFTAALKQKRNAPETLIYLNNARIGNRNSLKIAVSVPIGTNLNVAQEILRGVAQAQDEINRLGGINGKLLKVVIANDDNDPSIAQQIATQFVKDNSILAVVGHNASNASVAAAPVYQYNGLVMVSPTSFSQNLSGIGTYIFRIVPSVSVMAETIAKYAIKTAGKTNILVCVDANAIDNQSFHGAFAQSIVTSGGKVNPQVCDFSTNDFNSHQVISEAINRGADALLIAPHIDKIHKGLEIVEANNGRLPMFSSPTLYTYQTLNSQKADVNGMVLPVPWHPTAIANNPFPENAKKLWGGSVNWRTATSYDAVMAIAQALETSNNRKELQKVLRSPNFYADGATGEIQFLSSGDRSHESIKLVKIQRSSKSPSGYDFAPINQGVLRQ